MRFEQQVIVVTGASRGIGRALAEAFAKEGGKVACVATTLEGAEGAASAIGGKGYACDISQGDQVESTFKKIAEELGSPSVLINNAGITRDGLIMRMKDEDWDRVIEVNLKGAFLCTRAATKLMMRERYGRVVNVSSVIGLHGASGQANYAAAKAGLIGLTMSVAKEFGSRNITCNAVAPGFIETDMTESLPEDFKQHVIKSAPAGRLGTANDIAPAILFLASRDAGYITGQTLTIDGGLML